MVKPVVLTAFLILMQGCALTEQSRSSIERDIADMYSAHYSVEMQQFFVEEAIRAGVVKIRAMQPADKRPASNKNEIIGCARVDLANRTVLVEVNQPLCLMPAHLAHEIAHIGSNCGAHDGVFYRYNFKIAKRYEERFPNAATRQWFAPVQSVANVQAIYTNGQCQVSTSRWPADLRPGFRFTVQLAEPGDPNQAGTQGSAKTAEAERNA